MGRATTFLVAVAVILALSVGLASAALAGTGVRAAFNLGKSNTVDALSSPVGSTSSSMLKVDGVDMPLSGSTIVDPPIVGAHSCVQSSVTIPGKNGTDSGLLFPTRNFTLGPNGIAANVTLVTHAGVGADSADKLFYTMCNVGDFAADPPSGNWAYVIFRV